MIQNASIYKNSNKYVIYANSTTTNGISIAHEPYVILTSNVSSKDLETALKYVISKSKTGINHPKDWELEKKKYLEGMQIKSLKGLYSDGAILCDVILKDGIFIFYPMKNSGIKNGFVLILKTEFTATQENLGESIFKALNMCL